MEGVKTNQLSFLNTAIEEAKIALERVRSAVFNGDK